MKSNLSKRQKIKRIFESLAWCIATFILLYYTRFFKELIDSQKKNELFYEIFLISFFINLFLSIFVSLILPLCGYKNDEEFSPYLVFIGICIRF